MINVLVLSVSAALAAPFAQSTVRTSIALRDLTVGAERLPTGCTTPSSDSERLADNKVRGGVWPGLPIKTNPWMGTDRPVLAEIRERIEGPFIMVPDGPPLPLGEFTAFRMRLADGVEEGYAAVYKQDAAPELLIVYGLRFPDADRARASLERTRTSTPNPRAVRVAIGPIVAVLNGDGGACFQVLAAHLRSLADKR